VVVARPATQHSVAYLCEGEMFSGMTPPTAAAAASDSNRSSRQSAVASISFHIILR
jgi:hypothetical protein